MPTLWAAGLLCLLFSGCAALPNPLELIKPAATAASSTPATTVNAETQAPATRPAPAVAAAVEAERPVPAAAQRAFDEARRLLAAGRMQEAERAFAALAKEQPELGGAYANLGLIQRQAGRNDEAVQALEQAVRVSPKQPLYFNQLGIAYRQVGRFDKAREAYERAVDLDAHYGAALLNLAILNDLYLRDGARALALYERYLALTPSKDGTVTKWVADLKNRKPERSSDAAADKTLVSKKEQP